MHSMCESARKAACEYRVTLERFTTPAREAQELAGKSWSSAMSICMHAFMCANMMTEKSSLNMRSATALIGRMSSQRLRYLNIRGSRSRRRSRGSRR